LIIGLVIGLFVGVSVAATGFIYVVLSLTQGLPSSPFPLIAIGVLPQLLFLVVGYLWMTRRLNGLPLSIPSVRELEALLAGMVGAFALQLGIDILRQTLAISDAPTTLTRLGRQNPSVLLFAIAA
jgi:hypothetical protein